MRNVPSFYKSVLGVIELLLVSALSIENASAQNFTRITSGTLVSDFGGFLGAAWGDYDNDGNVDLFVADYLQSNPNLLYHNEGNGSFTKATTGDITTDKAISFSGSWGDYDNDSDLDLFVANNGRENFLYRNDGTTFTKIIEGTIVTDGGNCVSGSWGDYDNDGDLDLFVTRNGQDNLLYQNNGNGTFTKITRGDIVNDRGYSVVGLWADYDNDGDLDLYVVNGYFSLEKNFLYRNEGKGNFTKITEGAIVTDVEGSTGGSWGDYDNDGYLDLYVTNSVNNAPNSLYHNNGDGTFTKITTGDMVTDLGHSIGSSWIDYDNDGNLDLFVVNVFASKNNLYRNNGDGSFTKITSGAIVNDWNWSFGCSWADYDNDGDQDVIVTNGGISLTWPNFFYRNDGNQNKWINIQCIGTVSNTSAIGIRINIKASIFGKSFWQIQEIAGQTGWLGQNSLNAEFGLGDATTIDSIIVSWPSGIKQVVTDVVPNQKIVIKEPMPYQHDLLISGFTNPVSPIPIFTNQTPIVVIRNIGINEASNVSVECQIDSIGTTIYSQTRLVPVLKSNEVKEVNLDKWIPSSNHTYQITFYVQYGSDENRSNDTLKTTVEVSNLLDDLEMNIGHWDIGQGWRRLQGIAHSGIYSLNNSNGPVYENNLNSSATFVYSFDLSQLESAYISYWTKHLIELNHDYGYVEVSVDSGQSWQQLGASYTGIQNAWKEDSRSLTDYCGTGFDDVRIRFRFVSDSTMTLPGWYIDDINIYLYEITTVNKATENQILDQFVLYNNYPNPFNPETTIEYELPKAGSIQLEVYNLLGQKIKTLIDQNQAAGVYRIVWDGKNEFGEKVASGIYLYRMETNDFKATKRMLLLR